MTATKIIIAIIVAIAAVAAGALVVFRRAGAPQPPGQPTVGPRIEEPSATPATGLAGSLVVVNKGGQIERINLADSSRITIIKDEKLRLAKTAPTAGQLVTVTTATASTANLNLLDPATGKSTKLAELSLSGAPPVVSPDGKQYLSASFSNFEVEFGWHVYVNTVGSSSKKEIFASAESLTAVAFSPDSKRVAFVVSKGKGGSEVTVVDLSQAKQNSVYKTDAEVISLAWGGSTIYFVEAPSKKGQANAAELYQMTETGKDKKQLTKNDRAENFVAASSDGLLVGYLEVSYPSGNVTPDTTGTVIVLDTTTKKSTPYSEAVQLAGFER